MSSPNGTTAEVDAGGLPPGVTPPSGAGGRFLSDVIVGLGFAGRETVDQALDASRAPGKKLGTTLVEMGALTERELGRAVAERYRLDFLDLAEFDIDPEAVHVIGDAEMRRYDAVPVAFTEDGALVVAMIDPADWLAAEEMAQMTGRRIRRAVAAPSEVMELMKRVAEARAGSGDDDAHGSGDDAANMPVRLTLRPVTRPLAGRAFGLERPSGAVDGLDGGPPLASESASAEPNSSAEAAEDAPTDIVARRMGSSSPAQDETFGEQDQDPVDEATQTTAPAPSDDPAEASAADAPVDDSAAPTGPWSPAPAAAAAPVAEEEVAPAPEAASDPSTAEPAAEPDGDEQSAFGDEPPREEDGTEDRPKLVFSSIVRDDASAHPEQETEPTDTVQDEAPSFAPWAAPVDTSHETPEETEDTPAEPSVPDDGEPVADKPDAGQPLDLPEPPLPRAPPTQPSWTRFALCSRAAPRSSRRAGPRLPRPATSSRASAPSWRRCAAVTTVRSSGPPKPSASWPRPVPSPAASRPSWSPPRSRPRACART